MSRIIDLATDSRNAAHDGDYYVVDHPTLGTRKIPCGRNVGSAIGNYSHAEGQYTTASGGVAHAEGYNTTASGYASHAEGSSTTATNTNSHAMGHWNSSMVSGASTNNTRGTAFVIGNGTSPSNLSNAFSVVFDGTVKAANTITASTTADYAEFFEFADQNPNKEDRVGRFVTFDDADKIRIATPDDNYILGVVSGAPFVLGNGDCDVWNGMYLRDDFGRYLTEPAPKVELVEVKDDDGNVVDVKEEIVPGEFEGETFVVNPDYDPSTPYVSRMDRPEWAAVGMLGVLSIYDNGECQVNRYCTVGENGIAVPVTKDAQIASGNFYRVIGRVSENVIKIVFR